MSYKIASHVYDESRIQIQGVKGDIVIFNKLIDLDINGNGSPTFGESRYEYNEKVLEDFILDIKSDTSSMFLFDENEADERMDGIMFVATQDSTMITFTTSYGKNTISVYMDLETDKDVIIADLYTLKSNIKVLIDERMKFLKLIGEDNKDEKDTIDEKED